MENEYDQAYAINEAWNNALLEYLGMVPDDVKEAIVSGADQ